MTTLRRQRQRLRETERARRESARAVRRRKRVTVGFGIDYCLPDGDGFAYRGFPRYEQIVRGQHR